MNSLLPKLVGALINSIGLFNNGFASRLALKLFSKPRQGKLSFKDHLFLDTANKSRLQYNNFAIQTYHWEGVGDTVLLVHGWESNSKRWRNKVKKLTAEGYDVVALDAPAHGASGSPDFNAVLYSEFINVVSLQFKPTVLIGHSVGGMAVVLFLHNQQHKTIKKAVLLGAPSNFKGILKRYTNMMGYSPAVCKGIENQILQKFGQPSSYFSIAKFAKALKIEGLIIHDKEDGIIPYTDALEIDKTFKNAKLLTTNGFGHGLKNERVTNEIIKFLRP